MISQQARRNHHHHRRTISAALKSLLLLPILSAALPVQDADAQQLVGPPRTNMSLARAAMVYQFRQTRDPGLLAEQVYALDLYMNGVPSDDIVKRTIAKRQEWARLKETAIRGDYRASEFGKTIARAFGRIATQRLGLGGSGVEVVNLGFQAYENYMAGRAVPRAAQRLVEEIREGDEEFTRPEATVFPCCRADICGTH